MDIEWFGHAGHFIAARRCNFHLTTRVGDYLVSTVGDWRLDDGSKEPTEIGYGRLYETMVFRAGKPCDAEGCHCGLPEISGRELDIAGYNTGREARDGHMAMIGKYQDLGANGCSTPP